MIVAVGFDSCALVFLETIAQERLADALELMSLVTASDSGEILRQGFSLIAKKNDLRN
jgi:hypothetical protein